MFYYGRSIILENVGEKNKGPRERGPKRQKHAANTVQTVGNESVEDF